MNIRCEIIAAIIDTLNRIMDYLEYAYNKYYDHELFQIYGMIQVKQVYYHINFVIKQLTVIFSNCIGCRVNEANTVIFF